jgi:hypothetical protein
MFKVYIQRPLRFVEKLQCGIVAHVRDSSIKDGRRTQGKISNLQQKVYVMQKSCLGKSGAIISPSH